jgi:hypothetical protein
VTTKIQWYFGERDLEKLMTAIDPEKSRKRSSESIEYQPPPSQDPTSEPESSEAGSDRRNEETDAQSKEDSV